MSSSRLVFLVQVSTEKEAHVLDRMLVADLVFWLLISVYC